MAGAAIGAGALIGAQRTIADEVQPSRKRGVGGTDPGPRNLLREQQDPDMVNPPPTDHGTLPNLRFTYADSHIRQEGGGWTRQITERELGVSKSIAGVNMRLNAGGVRELHWHKEADWAYMLYAAPRGLTRLTRRAAISSKTSASATSGISLPAFRTPFRASARMEPTRR